MFIGIDPGLQGGIAVINPLGQYCGSSRMPILKVAGKTTIDVKALHAYLDYWSVVFNDTYIMIEDVHAMPKQGVVSMFTFGYGCGGINACAQLIVEAIVLKVRPQEWKAHYDLIKKDKQAGLLVIENVYPEAAAECVTPRGKLLDGIVDAILIAGYAYDKFNR